MARGEEENFLRRWSRRKRAASPAPGKAPVAAPAAEPVTPELPVVGSLTFESDFQAFMRAKIDERVRRAALKKLFADPRFNVMDGLDTYIDDYAEGESIPPELLARLEHAKSTLLGPEPRAPADAAAGAGGAEAPDPAPAPNAEPANGTDGATG